MLLPLPCLRAAGLGNWPAKMEQVALSLRVARKSLMEEAGGEFENQNLWTESRLQLVQARFGESALIVVSNREPYQHAIRDEGAPECLWPASGVVTAVDPIMRACGGTWIAHGSGSADRQFVNSHSDKRDWPISKIIASRQMGRREEWNATSVRQQLHSRGLREHSVRRLASLLSARTRLTGKPLWKMPERVAFKRTCAWGVK